jgi:hypothetical protein
MTKFRIRGKCTLNVIGRISLDSYHSFIHSQALIVQDGPMASLFGVSCSHTYRHTVGLLWTSDQPVALVSYWSNITSLLCSY